MAGDQYAGNITENVNSDQRAKRIRTVSLVTYFCVHIKHEKQIYSLLNSQ